MVMRICSFLSLNKNIVISDAMAEATVAVTMGIESTAVKGVI